MNLTYVSTHDLKAGDRIQFYGAILEIAEIHVSRSHPENEYSPTLWSRAKVIEPGNHIPKGWFGKDDHGGLTWTVQGNGLATWARLEKGEDQ